jgi:hypothetical protein
MAVKVIQLSMSSMKLSIIIPVKDERDNIAPLYQQLRDVSHALGLPCEFIFVDDGSMDGSSHILAELALRDESLKVVRLRRTFGQSAALKAGIDWSSGDVLITMDGDLQYDPADIPSLLDTLAQGHDAVLGLRELRHDTFLSRILPSHLANWLIRKVTGVNVKDMGCTFRAMPRNVAEMLPLYGQMHRFIPVLLQQCGAQMVQIPVRHYPRHSGESKYGAIRAVPVLFDLITVTFLSTYRTRPMHLFGLAGLATMTLGALGLLAMTGDTTLLISAALVLSGVHFIALGLIGELLVRTRYETQRNQPYTVRNTLNLPPPERRLRHGPLA